MISQLPENHRRIARLATLLFSLSLSGTTGCGLMRETHHVADLAKRTTYVEPRFYDYWRSDKLAQREARMIAEQAWGEVAATGVITNVSPDYQNGFTEGFADYLYRGGDGEPPVIPPRGYWNLRFWNQPGKHSINDWYDGFRHGVQTCKASGLRSMWVIPTSLLGGLDNSTDKLPNSQEQLWSAEPRRFAPQTNPQEPLNEDSADDTGPAEPTSAPNTDDEDVGDSDDPEESDSNLSDDSEGNAADNEGNDDEPDLSSLLGPDKSDASNETSDEPVDLAPQTDTESNPFGDEPEPDSFEPITDEIPLIPQATPPETPEVDEDNIFGNPTEAFESTDSFEVDDLEFNFESSQTRPNPRQPDRSLEMGRVSPASKIPAHTREQDAESIVVTSGLYDDDFPIPPENLEVIASSEEVPHATRSRQPRMLDSRVDAAADRVTPRFNDPSTIAPTVRHIAPIEMRVRHQLPRDEAPATNQLVSKGEPITMWIDDEIPSDPHDAATPIVVNDVDWDPFGEIEELRSQTDQGEPIPDVGTTTPEASGFYERSSDAETHSKVGLAPTRWAPDRKELPLRISDRSNSPKTRASESRDFYGQPIPHLQNPKRNSSLKMSEASEAEKLPRIYFRGAEQTNEMKPTNDDALQWTFKD